MQVVHSKTGQVVKVDESFNLDYDTLTSEYFAQGISDLSTDHKISQDCKRCKALCKTRKQVVQSRGRLKTAKVLFLGMNPGENENLTGVCFIGRSGQLLQKIINNLRLTSKDYFCSNVVRCYAGENRENTDMEIENCLEHLLHETDKATKIVALGNQAAYGLYRLININLQTHKPIIWSGKHWMKTYHPSYLLRRGGSPSLVDEIISILKNFIWEERSV